MYRGNIPLYGKIFNSFKERFYVLSKDIRAIYNLNFDCAGVLTLAKRTKAQNQVN